MDNKMNDKMKNKFQKHSLSKAHEENSSPMPLNPNTFKHKKVKKSRRWNNWKRWRSFGKTLLKIFLWLALAILFVAIIWMKVNVTSKLPDVSSIQNMVFPEATLIQDRNGETLYKIFHENRDYIKYTQVSPTMINAIVAIEDKNYRHHNGLDAIGLLKVAIHNFTHPNDMRGGSTIAQQLLKNLLLNKDWKKETFKERVIRKLKEFFLTSKLSDTLESEITKEQGKLPKEEMKTEIKKKTLELYLNYISFGNNAYGIESAAKTYFGKSAIDLNIMESAVLASLPKGPTYYNPYRHSPRIMWDLIITDANKIRVSWTGSTNIEKAAIDKLNNMLLNANLTNKRDNEAFVDFIKWLGSFSIIQNGINYEVIYKPGRKDVVLARMYDDGYINESELKSAFVKGLDYTFRTHKFAIKAPHFVHWIIEQLGKDFDKETLMNGWFIIKTTLDLDIQNKAEKAIKDNKDMMDYYGANNEAMVYLDSQNGDVLAYVGSYDYFNDAIGGQNDMLRSERQVGSSIKPFIYALGFQQVGLTIDTPIYDIPFKIGKDTPNNADGKFYGILPLRNALAYSRNIPAIKMFFALGWETVAKPFLQALGMTSLLDNHEYGYPMALGAGEIKILELANAYMHLSAWWKPAKINPILEIRTKDGGLIYKKEVKYQKETIKPGIAYILWNILSNKGNMPPSWVTKYSVPGLTLATKSWTSNMKNDRNLNRARDGLLVGYTPSKVLVMRWWNTDGKPMNQNAYGWYLNANALREFLWDLVQNHYIQSENMAWLETTTVQISSINGWIAWAWTPSEFALSSMAYAYKLPEKNDPGMTPITYDKMCNGKVSPYTPVADIGNGYLMEATSFMPNNMDLKDIKNRRKESLAYTGAIKTEDGKRPYITYNYHNIFTTEPTEYCEWRMPKLDDSISLEIRSPQDGKAVTTNMSILFSAASTARDLRSVIVFVDGKQFANFSYEGKKNITDMQNLDLSALKLGKHTIKMEAIDVRWFANWQTITVKTIDKDTEAPILLKNKISVKEVTEEWTWTWNNKTSYDIILLFEDKLSSIVWWKIMIGNTTIKEFEGSLASFTLPELTTISMAVTDSFKNVLKEDIDLRKYK